MAGQRCDGLQEEVTCGLLVEMALISGDTSGKAICRCITPFRLRSLSPLQTGRSARNHVAIWLVRSLAVKKVRNATKPTKKRKVLMARKSLHL